MDPRGPLSRDWHVRHVAQTGSTNADLLAEAATGAPDRTVLRTDHQTAGRGRLDRRWDAPPGTNLLVSLLFRDGAGHGSPVELMRRVAIAAVDAVAVTTGIDARLKWPNDVLAPVRGSASGADALAKLAGMLAQRGTSPDGDVTVIGLGLNVGWAPDGAASLGGAIAPAALLDALLAEYDAFAAATADQVHARYCELLATLGQQVRVELPVGELVGHVTGVEPDGRLIVLDECAITHRVDVGDVVHVRQV